MLSLETVSVEVSLQHPGRETVRVSSPRAQRRERSGSESASSAHVRCSAPSSFEEEEGRPGLTSKHFSLPTALAIYFIGMVITLYIAKAFINMAVLKPFPQTSLAIYFVHRLVDIFLLMV